MQLHAISKRAPGLWLTYGIAMVAEELAKRTALSPLLWAAVVGMMGKAAWPSSVWKMPVSGISFAKARLLRLGIVCYGVKLTVQQIAGIGAAGFLTDLFTVSTALPLGIFLGRALGIAAPLATLISTGAAICGCSAVAAAQPIVEGESHEVAAGVGTVVLCGTCAMFLYPLFYTHVPFLAADPRLMAIFTGASVHELAGVVAAGAAMGPDVATTAIVTKLVRVCLLAPALLLLSRFPALKDRRTPAERLAAPQPPEPSSSSSAIKRAPPLPWFALGFVAVAALNSVLTLDKGFVKLISKLSATFLAMAMAALGLDTDLGKIKALGARPVVLALALWAYLLVVVGGVARVLVRVLP